MGNTVKLYEVQTQGALNVQGFGDLYREEPIQDGDEIIPPDRFAIDPTVQKRLLVDFADLGISPDNLEGMSLGPVLADGRQSLIVVSDNNFNSTQTTQVIALGLDMETLPAVLPVVETPYTIDDEAGETPLVGDSDDPAVWIDPQNPEASLVIATLKDGGLAVFNLQGEILQTITPADQLGDGAEYGDLRYNNVDVLYNFSLGEEKVDIAIVSDRQNDTLNIFKIDPNTRQLVNITADSLSNP
ncbi:MAG: phytase, partial [Microcystaceae cyanobacterium]